MEIRPVESRSIHGNGQADMTKLRVAFRNFANASKNWLYYQLRRQAVACIYIHATPRLACTNLPIRYTVYGMMLLTMDW